MTIDPSTKIGSQRELMQQHEGLNKRVQGVASNEDIIGEDPVQLNSAQKSGTLQSNW